MARFELHPRLIEDCHCLDRFELSQVLLHRNALLPWFILVPEVEPRLTELHELDGARRRTLDDELDVLARFLKSQMGATKVNIAAIGNIVPQLHLHVVGRREDDPCWPGVVWGRLPPGPAWSSQRLAEIRDALRAGGGTCFKRN
jgi:diadenosine tetraphosphate (Ap4A) HIT family hydrolase